MIDAMLAGALAGLRAFAAVAVFVGLSAVVVWVIGAMSEIVGKGDEG